MIGLGLASKAVAQSSYPDKPIYLIIGFPPGGGADSVARILSVKLGQILGTSVVVENRPGASGEIADEYVWRAQPDGYNFLISPEDILISSHLKKLPYSPLKDLRAVSMLTTTDILLVATPSLKVNNVADLIKLAKSQPGKVYFGSSGVGGPNYLAGELFNQLAGVNLVDVPYSGTGAVIPAVMSGEVSVMFGFVPGLTPYVKANSVKPLAVGGIKRSPALPNVPTMQEAGVPDYNLTSFIGLFAPLQTPEPIVTKVQQALVQALQDPGVKQKLAAQGQQIAASTPDQFKSFLQDRDVVYATLIKSLNLQQ
jgi:tripartite-type tricarboxylate transporter receptor subunit TctC